MTLTNEVDNTFFFFFLSLRINGKFIVFSMLRSKFFCLRLQLSYVRGFATAYVNEHTNLLSAHCCHSATRSPSLPA